MSASTKIRLYISFELSVCTVRIMNTYMKEQGCYNPHHTSTITLKCMLLIFKKKKTITLLKAEIKYSIMCGSRGETGGPDLPSKITKYRIFLAILVPIPLKSLSYQASFQFWAIIGLPTKRHLNGVSLAGQKWPAYSSIWISPPIKLTKTLSMLDPPLTKLSGSAHVHI